MPFVQAYQIAATLGPASQEPGTWKAMLEAGATSFRLNTSHLTLDQMQSWLERYQDFVRNLSPRPALVLDLQGSKWRLGKLPSAELDVGAAIELVHASESDRAGVLPVPHGDFFAAAAASSGELVLNDAKVRLAIDEMHPGRLMARVLQGGPVSSNKGITLPSSQFRKEELNEKDRTIFTRTQGFEGVRYAISYVRDAIEMERYRGLLGPAASLIAKLERQTALDDAARLADSADELWLCRGDLGAELGQAGMAAAAHQFSLQVRQASIPTLLAGQVLEHMVASATPTRSEVSCIYDALAAGYAGVVLSDETAVGQYPLEAVRAAAMFRGG